MAHISVIIPVYKAEGSLPELYKRLKVALEKITEDYEIVMVEDCGGDRSWQIICELASQNARVKGIQFSRNFGQHYGITAGLDYCNGDWVVVMDCDLQDLPEEISRLYAKAMEGYDVVLAKRGQRRHQIIRKIVSRLFYGVFNYLAGNNYNAQVGNFRIISKKVVNNFRLMRENLRFFGGLVAWMGFLTASIEVQHAERISGKSTYSYKKLWKLATEIIIAYSDKLLVISIKTGFIVSLIAFILGVYFVLRKLIYGVPVTGWASVIVSLYFLGGVIITTLGIFGLYLGKTFDETKKRPLYIINESRNV